MSFNLSLYVFRVKLICNTFVTNLPIGIMYINITGKNKFKVRNYVQIKQLKNIKWGGKHRKMNQNRKRVNRRKKRQRKTRGDKKKKRGQD